MAYAPTISNGAETRACSRHCEERSDAAIQRAVPAILGALDIVFGECDR